MIWRVIKYTQRQWIDRAKLFKENRSFGIARAEQSTCRIFPCPLHFSLSSDILMWCWWTNVQIVEFPPLLISLRDFRSQIYYIKLEKKMVLLLLWLSLQWKLGPATVLWQAGRCSAWLMYCFYNCFSTPVGLACIISPSYWKLLSYQEGRCQ